MRLKLWAPCAEKVEVAVQGTRLPMDRVQDGKWESVSPLYLHGADYCIVLDREFPIPDPRSAWQPKGVNGPSRILDHGRFRWTDDGWQAPPLSSAVVYELHVGTFSPEGTFEGAARFLDHLKDLGVTHVELMPVNGFSGTRGWGYDGVNLFAPHQAYGGPEGLKTLVDACHGKGLAVILDVVYNHLGPEGNYLERFGPYLTDRHPSPWGKSVNFDGPQSDEVRRFFCDNALMWLRHYHFDGLRVDAVHAIVDTSAVHILEQLSSEVKALGSELGRHLVLIAESALNDPRVVRPREIGGYGVDAQWSDDFHHALHVALTGERNGYYVDFQGLCDVAKALTRAFVYDGRYSEFRGRSHGRPVEGLSGHRFLAFLQNHDQVGNRAQGERLGHMVSTGLLKTAAALMIFSPFVPMLFQGEEWGAATPFQYFTDHQDTDLGKAVSEGRKREFAGFGWDAAQIPDPQTESTFKRSVLRWGEKVSEPHKGILHWYRDCIRLRKSIPSLLDGRMDRVRVSYDEKRRWLAMERGSVTVACNFSRDPQWVPLQCARTLRIILRSEEDGEKVDGRFGGVSLPSESVAVLESAPQWENAPLV